MRSVSESRRPSAKQAAEPEVECLRSNLIWTRLNRGERHYQEPHPEATVEMVLRMIRRSKSIEAFWR